MKDILGRNIPDDGSYLYGHIIELKILGIGIGIEINKLNKKL